MTTQVDLRTRFATQRLANVDSSKFALKTFASKRFRTTATSGNKPSGLFGLTTGKGTSQKTVNIDAQLTFSSDTLQKVFSFPDEIDKLMTEADTAMRDRILPHWVFTVSDRHGFDLE